MEIEWEASFNDVLVVSAMTAFISTGNLPYTANRVLIDTICAGVPIVSVLGTFLIFRRKFSRR